MPVPPPESQCRAKASGDTAEPGCPGALSSGHTLGPAVPGGVPRCPGTALTLCRVAKQPPGLQEYHLAGPDPTKSCLAVWGQPV